MTKKDLVYIVAIAIVVVVSLGYCYLLDVDLNSQVRQLKDENKALVDRVEALEVYAHVTDLKLEKRIETAEGNIKYLEDKDKYLDKE